MTPAGFECTNPRQFLGGTRLETYCYPFGNVADPVFKDLVYILCFVRVWRTSYSGSIVGFFCRMGGDLCRRVLAPQYLFG